MNIELVGVIVAEKDVFSLLVSKDFSILFPNT